MSAASLRRRLGRLTARLRLCDPDECDGRPTIILNNDEPIPDDARHCPRGGTVHALRIRIRVVGSGGEAVEPSAGARNRV